MRRVTVSAPEGQGQAVVDLAIAFRAHQASMHQVRTMWPDSEASTKDVVEIETAAPIARAFVDALMGRRTMNPEPTRSQWSTPGR